MYLSQTPGVWGGRDGQGGMGDWGGCNDWGGRDGQGGWGGRGGWGGYVVWLGGYNNGHGLGGQVWLGWSVGQVGWSGRVE